MPFRKTGSAADQSTILPEAGDDAPIRATAPPALPWGEPDEDGLEAENAGADG